MKENINKTTDEMVREMHTLLVGSEYHKKGLIQQVTENTEDIRKIKIFPTVIVTVGLILGFVIGFWKDIIQTFN